MGETGAPRTPQPGRPPSVRTQGRPPTANTFLTTARYTSRESPTPSWRRAQGSRSSPGREMRDARCWDTALGLPAFTSITQCPPYGLCSPTHHGLWSVRLGLVKHFCYQQGVICSCGGGRGRHRLVGYQHPPVSEPQGSCRTRHPQKDPCATTAAKDSRVCALQRRPGPGVGPQSPPALPL